MKCDVRHTSTRLRACVSILVACVSSYGPRTHTHRTQHGKLTRRALVRRRPPAFGPAWPPALSGHPSTAPPTFAPPAPELIRQATASRPGELWRSMVDGSIGEARRAFGRRRLPLLDLRPTIAKAVRCVSLRNARRAIRERRRGVRPAGILDAATCIDTKHALNLFCGFTFADLAFVAACPSHAFAFRVCSIDGNNIRKRAGLCQMSNQFTVSPVHFPRI